jgi:hypothetical protein
MPANVPELKAWLELSTDRFEGMSGLKVGL